MPVNAIFWTLKEVVILYKRCTSSLFPHTPVKQSFVELSIRSGFLQRCRVFFINSEPPILKTLKLLTVNSHRNMQITTKWAELKIPLLFTKRIHCWYTTLVIFATIAALGVPVLSLKGSISYNHMDIMITSASVQLAVNNKCIPSDMPDVSLSFSAGALWLSLCTRSWKPFYTPTTTSRLRLKGSHYQHVNTMSPFPPHSSITNNRLGARVAARQQKENTWDILSGA